MAKTYTSSFSIHLFLRLFLLWGLTSSSYALQAQYRPTPPHAGELLHELTNMQVVGSVLYIAAHPDDENTRLISYLAGHRGYRVGYLSLTRGDGGQNLIGNEKGPLLGLLRTQELLGARSLDGGEQMFSRAIDFGYSKTPEETLKIWNKDKILADVVWAIRKFRPDVIITRFASPKRGGGGHGHHTSSAILAQEAFDIAADPGVYPEQLKYVEPWQPKRLFWNMYTWRYYEPTEEDIPNILSYDVDVYNPFLGQGYGEISSLARSMHRCQAFGNSIRRGELSEKIMFIKGEKHESDIFDDIDATWGRTNAPELTALFQQAKSAFRPEAPYEIVPTLLAAHKIMEEKLDPQRYGHKRKQLEALIQDALGLHLALNSTKPEVAKGTDARVILTAINRSPMPVKLKDLTFSQTVFEKKVDILLDAPSKLARDTMEISTQSLPVGSPYWLAENGEIGTYEVPQQKLIGLPENPFALSATVSLSIGEDNIPMKVEVPVIHTYVDRAKGELYQPFRVSPSLTANFADNIFLFGSEKAREITVRVKAYQAVEKAAFKVVTPSGWKVTPGILELADLRAGEERNVMLSISPPDVQGSGWLSLNYQGKSVLRTETIAYDHIPKQVAFLPNEAKLVRLEVEKRGTKIGYVMGSGDEIPINLQQIGYEVKILQDGDFTQANLSQYDAIIAGIRAFNTKDEMAYYHSQILEYVDKGGTYIVQYNTSRFGNKSKDVGPYKLQISRDRITEEDAKMKMLEPDHPIFNYPNKITQKDFEGWVQERGLYFPNEWDARYIPLIEGHDKGEDPKKGALLVADYGKGKFVYCAFSMFRELPAGVPGAYRLFANMISWGKKKVDTSDGDQSK
ncbi:MAG: PIG-L family deacetylase [Bacteroidota bacterium]